MSVSGGRLQKKFFVEAYQYVLTMVFAIEEINHNIRLLPNTTLGFEIFDSCYEDMKAVECVLRLLSGSKDMAPNYNCHSGPQTAVIIGDILSSATMQVARILGLYRFPQLLHHIRSVLFTNSAGETMFFDENGDLPAVYDILNWQLLPDGTSRYMKVGMFDSTLPDEQSISINDSAIVWGGGYTQTPASVCSDLCPPGHRKAHLQGQPPCCFDCIPCPMGEISSLGDAAECVKCPDYLWPNGNQDKCIPKHVEFLSYEEPMGAALASISASFSVVTLVIFYIFTKYRDTPLVKANNRGLSYLLLMSLTLCFLCSLIFIGKPRRVTCLLRQVVFGIVFTVCVATVLAKTITVIVVFNATKPGSKLRMWVGPRTPYCIILFCSFIQTIICITWLSTSPPFVDFNMESEAGIITIECNEGSFTMFCCLLGYLGVLSSISFLVAFLARKLPDSFNEAKFITFSMLMFLSVWLLFIPTYLSSKGKYMVAEETFAILSSSSGLLGCIFFPKCYIILLRPERNSKKYLMRKTSS